MFGWFRDRICYFKHLAIVISCDSDNFVKIPICCRVQSARGEEPSALHHPRHHHLRLQRLRLRPHLLHDLLSKVPKMTQEPLEGFCAEQVLYYFIFSYSEGEGRGGSTRTIPLIKVEEDEDGDDKLIRTDIKIGLITVRMGFIRINIWMGFMRM